MATGIIHVRAQQNGTSTQAALVAESVDNQSDTAKITTDEKYLGMVRVPALEFEDGWNLLAHRKRTLANFDDLS
ncbi:MAG: hypothetical protein JWQ25_1265 [Daejeonella sp.]|nr:hypothetical protein [Daejeonella sp.]